MGPPLIASNREVEGGTSSETQGQLVGPTNCPWVSEDEGGRERERDLVTNFSPVVSRLGFSSQCVMGRDVHFRIILQNGVSG